MPIDRPGPSRGSAARSLGELTQTGECRPRLGATAGQPADGHQAPHLEAGQRQHLVELSLEGLGHEAGLGRVAIDVDLQVHRQTPPGTRTELPDQSVEADRQGEGVHRLDRIEELHRLGHLVLLEGPTRCQLDGPRSGILAAASCTRFSPSRSWPAACARSSRSTGTVLEMATSVAASAARPERTQAAAMRSRTSARAAASSEMSRSSGGPGSVSVGGSAAPAQERRMSRSSSLAAPRPAAATTSPVETGTATACLASVSPAGRLVAGRGALAGQLLHEVAVLETGLHAGVGSWPRPQGQGRHRRGCCRSRWR